MIPIRSSYYHLKRNPVSCGQLIVYQVETSDDLLQQTLSDTHDEEFIAEAKGCGSQLNEKMVAEYGEKDI